MKKIQMADLVTQYEKIAPQIDQKMKEVLGSAAFINGQEVKDFASDLEAYLNVKHVIPCANGTDALQIAMMALGLKPGDEVITTSFTFIATVEVIALLQLKPVLVEIDEKTYNMDPSALEKAITSNTKAIVPVHLFGQCANMEEISKIASDHNIPIIEDNAQAIGADYTFSDGRKTKSGTIGDIGCTSFFPSKNLGAYGDGGAIFTNNDELALQMRRIVNHGQTRAYIHDFIGVNSRLDTLQAAVLRIKLPMLDEYCKARYAVASAYNEAFSTCDELITPYEAEWSTHVYHQYTLRVLGGKREALMEHLSSKDIPTKIYYPVPAHKQKAFGDFIDPNTSLALTDEISEQVMSLPIHTEMEEEQSKYIIENVLAFFK